MFEDTERRRTNRQSARRNSDDAREKFVHDFVAAWDKVMEADRFDRG